MKRLVYTSRSHARRGSLLYGYAACMLVLGTLCHLIGSRAVESYHDSRRAEVILAARAAAEGAALLHRDTSAPESFMVGRSDINVTTPSEQPGRRELGLQVLVRNSIGDPVEVIEYEVVYTPGTEVGTWKVHSLQRR